MTPTLKGATIRFFTQEYSSSTDRGVHDEMGNPENRSRNQRYWSRTRGSNCGGPGPAGSMTKSFGGVNRMMSSTVAVEIQVATNRSARETTSSNLTRNSSANSEPSSVDGGASNLAAPPSLRSIPHSERFPYGAVSGSTSGATSLSFLAMKIIFGVCAGGTWFSGGSVVLPNWGFSGSARTGGCGRGRRELIGRRSSR